MVLSVSFTPYNVMAAKLINQYNGLHLHLLILLFPALTSRVGHCPLGVSVT